MASRTDLDKGLVGLVAYNGFEFPSPHSCKVSASPVMDSAGRAVKYVLFTITVEAVITSEVRFNSGDSYNTASQNTDTVNQGLRARLLASGKELHFTDQGYGDFVVNHGRISFGGESLGSDDSAQRLDSMWGPIPLILDWSALGSQLANRIVWQCTTALPECPTAIPGQFADRLAEFNYDISWHNGGDGAVSRTISGTMEIPMTVQSGVNNNTIPDSADKDVYLRVLNNAFRPLQGFHRDIDRSLSRDRRFLSFAITDAEVTSDNPLFPNMVQMDISHDVGSNLELGFQNWQNSIGGSITVAPGRPKHLAWIAFLNIVKSRLKNVHQGAVTGNSGSDPSRFHLLNSVRIGESLMGRSLNFSIDYTLTCDISKILQASSMFQPVLSDWDLWHVSLEDIQRVQGRLGLGHSPQGEVIVNLCTTNTSVDHNSPARVGDRSIKAALFLDSECPPERYSWIKYDNKFRIVEYPAVAENRPLKPQRSTSDAIRAAAAALTGSTTSTAMADLPGSSTPDRKRYNRRAPSRWTIEMTGSAMRAGYGIPQPKITKVGGQKVHLSDEGAGFEFTLLTHSGGCPIYAAKWQLIYYIEGNPAGDLLINMESTGIPNSGLPGPNNQSSSKASNTGKSIKTTPIPQPT